jgi:hypothetical protein
MRLAVYLSVGFFFVVFPVSTLAAQAWEQRNWPTLQAKIIEVVPIEGTNKRVRRPAACDANWHIADRRGINCASLVLRWVSVEGHLSLQGAW